MGKTLAEARIPDRTGLVVLAVHHGDSPSDEIDFNPGAATELQAGDEVTALGNEAQIRRLREYLGVAATPGAIRTGRSGVASCRAP